MLENRKKAEICNFQICFGNSSLIYLCYMREIESVAEMCEELNCLFCFVNLCILRGKSLNSYLSSDVPDILKKLKQTSRLHPTCQLAIVCQST